MSATPPGSAPRAPFTPCPMITHRIPQVPRPVLCDPAASAWQFPSRGPLKAEPSSHSSSRDPGVQAHILAPSAGPHMARRQPECSPTCSHSPASQGTPRPAVARACLPSEGSLLPAPWLQTSSCLAKAANSPVVQRMETLLTRLHPSTLPPSGVTTESQGTSLRRVGDHSSELRMLNSPVCPAGGCPPRDPDHTP